MLPPQVSRSELKASEDHRGRPQAQAPAPQPIRNEDPRASARAATGDDWISPFEDELDVPTFLRRRGSAEEEEDELETPAFLRRSAD
jgi:hypothetical protein